MTESVREFYEMAIAGYDGKIRDLLTKRTALQRQLDGAVVEVATIPKSRQSGKNSIGSWKIVKGRPQR